MTMFWMVSYKVRGEWCEEMFKNADDMREWCENSGLLNSKRKVEFRRKMDNCWQLFKPAWLWD